MTETPKGWGRARKAAALIEAAQERRVPKLSNTAAAQKIHISATWWGAMIKGRRSSGCPVVPSDENLLKMARVVGAEDEVRAALGLDPAGSPAGLLQSRALRDGAYLVVITRVDGRPITDEELAEALEALPVRLDLAYGQEAASPEPATGTPQDTHPGP